MSAPDSQDLRRRVINAYYNKEGSQEARTQEELDRAITDTEDDIFGWFAHCGLFI